VPLLNVDGMPLGVQLAGARGEDGKLIGTAERLMALVSV
jgi:Asp-tRNA(Asn)/Glu-tRNA(Gln) amidotransferase A subunit family amidase